MDGPCRAALPELAQLLHRPVELARAFGPRVAVLRSPSCAAEIATAHRLALAK
jgi:hypothetical protein